MSNRVAIAITIASGLGISACVSSPDRIAAADRAPASTASEAAVTTPEHCPSDWTIGAPVRHLGNPTPFSDRSPANEGC